MDEQALPLTELLLIHELLLDHFGGMRGVTEQGFGKLEAALAAPYVSMFGEDLYPDIPTKVAILFYRIARSHGFSDGNKRVALVALLDGLERYDMRIVAGQDELYEFVIAAASDAPQEAVIAWLLARIETGKAE
jgi:death-on-curing protein